MSYPGHVVTAGATSQDMQAVAARLSALGYHVPKDATRFDQALVATIRLFQSQHVDALGRSGQGHTGFVRQSVSGALRTVAGNSNNDGSRNGVGVFDLNRRTVSEPGLKGFLDFTTA